MKAAIDSQNKKEYAEVIGIKIFRKSLEKALKKFQAMLHSDEVSTIFTPNTEFIMMANEDQDFKDILNRSDLNIPDGFGLILASRIQHLGIEEKMAGVDFMGRMLEICAQDNLRIYLIGGAPGRAALATERIEEQFPGIRIGGSQHGYFTADQEQEIVDSIASSESDILFVALGAPRQEKWIDANRHKLNVKVAMGVGGSIDIYAGEATRAPDIFIRLGLEWFYRLIKEPKRIGRMMVIPKFLIKIISNKISNH